MLTTDGPLGSYCTTTARAASRASSTESATTMPTTCPMCLVSVAAKHSSSCAIGPRPSFLPPGGRSSANITVATPGMARAVSASIETILAGAIGARTSQPCSVLAGSGASSV